MSNNQILTIVVASKLTPDVHRCIGRRIRKLVLNPNTAAMKQEWLQTLHLCSLTLMPADVASRSAYTSDTESESEYESDEYEYYEDEVSMGRSCTQLCLLVHIECRRTRVLHSTHTVGRAEIQSSA